jgi:hypothetical protein
MIDYDLNKIKILPANHIVLKDFDYAVGVDKKNKALEKIVFGLITAGVLMLTYHTIKNAEERNKEQR